MTDMTLGQLFADQLIQVTLIAGLVTLIASISSRVRPHLAFLLLLLVLVKCLTPPVIPGPFDLWPSMSDRPTELAARPGWQSAEIVPVPVESVPVVSEQVAGVASTAAPHSIVGSTPSSFWPTFILGIWAIGFAGVLARVVWQVRKARRDWERSECLSGFGLQQTCDRLALRLGLDRPVRLLINEAQYGPLVSGWRNPVIVLPKCLVNSGDRKDLELAIAHELVHIRRGDTFISALQILVQAVWWFHPLVWWTNRVLDRACEQCCDDEVIASLECTPARYARCLLTVVERKQQLNHVLALPGAQPLNITVARLSRLSKPANAFFRGTPWLYRVFIVLVAVALLPGKPFATWAGFPEEDEREAPTVTEPERRSLSVVMGDAETAFEAQEWDQAIADYRRIVEEDPENAFGWFRLGYALHMSGHIEEAMKCHEKTSTFARTKAIGLYNLACAYSLLDQPDQAMETLAKAIDCGYRAPPATVRGDSDFAALLDDPQFERLIERAGDVSTAPRYRALDFMIGDWEVHDEAGELQGRSRIATDEKGFLITEKWEAANGSTGTGIIYFDPKLGAWRQTYVGMFGNIAHLSGEFAEGRLSMYGETIFPNRATAQTKSVTTRHEDGSFSFVLRESKDDGATWYTAFSGTYSEGEES